MSKLLSLLLVALLLAFVPQSFADANVHKNQYLAEVQGPACPLCKLLVGKVKEAADQYKGVVTEEFKQLVCNKLPSTTQGLCRSFVDEYGPRVIDALLNKLDPEAVCSKLGLCDDAVWYRRFVTDKDAYLIYMELEKMGESNDNCALCKYIVGEVEQYANSSREELEHRLLKACELLPGQLEQLCDTVILLYGPQILDYILTYETPEIVCKQIGLCAKTLEEAAAPAVVAPVVVEDDNDGKCELCKYVLNLAQEYIQGNATEEKIKESLHKVCNRFPPIAGMCISFVDQYEPLIVQYLLAKFTPEEICAKIGLCPKKVIVELDLNDETTCPLCKFVVNTVEEYLVKNESIAIIEQKVQEICGYLPDTYSGMCKAMAQMYIPQIIQYLKEKYSPAAVCEAIGVCPKSAEEAPKMPTIEGPKVVQMRTN